VTTHLLVTGCYRSGTTLLERLLHSHPDISVADQPCPGLFHRVKSVFNHSRGFDDAYPLSPLFLERRYTPDHLEAFLRSYRIDMSDWQSVSRSGAYEEAGGKTPEILPHIREKRSEDFDSALRGIQSAAAQIFGKSSASVHGSKEVLCEEFLPHLLKTGFKSLIIIRDPREVIVSHNFNRRDNLTGAARPVLYTLRLWRKSVAFALALSSSPDSHWLRYEDLVAAPSEELQRCSKLLGVEAFPPGVLKGELYDQWGRPWRGNSSFVDRQGVAKDPVTRYSQILPARLTAFIEACCYPEMRLMGYAPTALRGSLRDAILIEEPLVEVAHEGFAADYDFNPTHLSEELERLKRLVLPADAMAPSEMLAWFIDPATRDSLAGALPGSV
jgi:hypothetical protein